MHERSGAQEDVRPVTSTPFHGASGSAGNKRPVEPGSGSDAKGKRPPRGPRGGTTTITRSGMVKKNLWIPEALAEELRTKAFRERRSEAEIIREALSLLLEGES